MHRTRRQALRSVVEMSGIGFLTTTITVFNANGQVVSGKKGQLRSVGAPFFVVFHGMLLFEFFRTSPRLIAHLPYVPPMPDMGDPGHLYEVGSRRTESDFVALQPDTYTLNGFNATDGQVLSEVKGTDNIVLPAGLIFADHAPIRTIVMPMPDHYWGWRIAQPSPASGKLLKTSNPNLSLPNQIYCTHVFVYNQPVKPVLLSSGGAQVWPKNVDPAGNILHIVAQPGVMLRRPGGPTPPDHTDAMNQMFNPPIDISNTGLDVCLLETPIRAGYPPRSQLLDIDEKSHRGIPACVKDRTTPRVYNGQLLNCKSYFLIQ